MNALIVTNFCFSSVRPYSVFCGTQPYITMDNIVKVSKHFDFCFIVNDQHSQDDFEFKYLPPHAIKNTQDIARLPHYDKKLQSKCVQFLNKNTLSAIGSEHNKKIILSHEYENLCLAGFTASLDIIATALALIDCKQKISILPTCIDDITDSRKQETIRYLNFIGVKSVGQQVE